MTWSQKTLHGPSDRNYIQVNLATYNLKGPKSLVWDASYYPLQLGCLLVPSPHPLSSMDKATTPYSWLFFLIFFFSLNFFHGGSAQFEQGDDPWLELKDDDVNMVQTQHPSLKNCNMSVGKWVYDQSYPLYDSSCPYLSTAISCQKNGRPDSDYQKWRWKPNGCAIPR